MASICKNKALLLDRDGVINVERCYVHRPEDFQFQDGILELCRAAQSLGYLLVVVTNQAGIARGYYTEADFLALTKWMTRRFADEQIEIARVYYCPYHPTYGVGEYKVDSSDRKPNPGMLLRAEADLNLDLSSSILVGDKVSDMVAGKAAGVGIRLLLSPSGWANHMDNTDWGVASSLHDVRYRFLSPLRPLPTTAIVSINQQLLD